MPTRAVAVPRRQGHSHRLPSAPSVRRGVPCNPCSRARRVLMLWQIVHAAGSQRSLPARVARRLGRDRVISSREVGVAGSGSVERAVPVVDGPEAMRLVQVRIGAAGVYPDVAALILTCGRGADQRTADIGPPAPGTAWRQLVVIEVPADADAEDPDITAGTHECREV